VRAAGRVLVVDDDLVILEIVRAALRDEGYIVDAAASVGSALDLLWRDWDNQPDVILLDLHLPAHDGRTFGELYALLPVRRAPVVLMTGADPAEAGDAAQVIGAAGVLLKPFALADLLTSVHRAMYPVLPLQPDLAADPADPAPR
jgi:CheY-like chemotaxis protein